MKKELEYQDFYEFCERANELRDLYAIKSDTPSFLMFKYRDYIYSHDYKSRYSETINNMCWTWLLSTTYEEMNINDLYSLLGIVKNSGRINRGVYEGNNKENGK